MDKKSGIQTTILTPEKYVELFTKYNSELSIEREEVSKNQLKFIKLKIEKGNLLSYKIIFLNKNKEIIQLDFSIVKKEAKDLKPTIEASIKSIELL